MVTNSSFIVDRDDLGLPIFQTAGGILEKGETSGAKDDTGILKEDKEKGSGTKMNMTPKGETLGRKGSDLPGGKSWSKVVKEPPPAAVTFDYMPLQEGNIIIPSDEELEIGNGKFKNCIIGTFTKKVPPFHFVSTFAHNLWGHKGLSNVARKNSSTFIFKFSDEVVLNKALSKGTWYVDKRPMVVKIW